MQRMSRSNLVTGVILIAIGLTLLLTQWLNINVWGVMWPLTIVAVGAMFFFGMLVGGRESAALAVPGSVISTIGLLLLFMNLFGHWQAWAYAWTLIVMAVGVGRYLQGYMLGDTKLQREGWHTITVGFWLFVFFGTFFELFIGISGYGGLGGYIWPLLLIGLGAYLILSWLGRPAPSVIETPLPTWNEPLEALPSPSTATPMPGQTPLFPDDTGAMPSVAMAPAIATEGTPRLIEAALPADNGSAMGGKL